MRSRLSLMTAALIAASVAVGLPTSAQAQSTPVPALPCVDLTVVTVNCTGPEPDPAPAAPACPGFDLVPSAGNLAQVRTATICLVNEERAKRDMTKLKSATSLRNVAGAYAKRMVKERFFAHEAPNGDTLITRIRRTTYLRGSWRRWSVGENIAWGTGRLATPEQIVDAWMASPGHRRNILTSKYTELGMGVALGAPVAGAGRRGATYVNEFGERRR